MAKQQHIGKPISGIIALVGLLILASNYYIAEPMRTSTIYLWGVIVLLLGLVLWSHHAGEGKGRHR